MATRRAAANPPNTSEWITPMRAQANIETGSSGTIGRWNVTRSPVCTPPNSLQQRRELVDPAVELLVGDLLRLLVLTLGHPDQRVLAAARLEVPIDAVDACVQTSADPPLPERRIARIENRVPLAIPRQHLGVLREALREVLLAEPLQQCRVVSVRLRDERLRRRVVLLLTPMNRDLRLRGRSGSDLRRARCSWMSCQPSNPLLLIRRWLRAPTNALVYVFAIPAPLYARRRLGRKPFRPLRSMPETTWTRPRLNAGPRAQPEKLSGCPRS